MSRAVINEEELCYRKSIQRRKKGLKNIEIDGRLATGIAFHEGNRSIYKEFVNGAHYLTTAHDAGRTEANYYLGMKYRTGRGVQMYNETAFQYFERETRSKNPTATEKLAKCYLFSLGTELHDPLALLYTKIA